MSYDGSVKIDTKILTENAEKDIDKLKNSAEKGANAIGTALAAIGTASAAAVGAAVKVGMDFESSMSQVAATMGITANEIQSGAKEFALLSDAAKKCGETTQFSASQAAEALNYLALAGYDAEKAASALPTVLNLAAAGGLDLGYASDMVTDSMSALGLEMSELNGFVDRMAKTSQKSNTSVGQLGEAILTVGGTAKSMAGGTKELCEILGVLADNGVKGSEGGTALRNVILSLSAPTKKASLAMKKLGLEAFDANGNLKPLDSVFLDLNKRLSTLSAQEKTEVLNEIFNKVDLKSVTALLGTSAARFDELSGYIENCDGAAAAMAETMNDNLKGRITILGSALEGLGIQIYEGVDEPLKNAVKGASESVGELTESIKSGELSGAVGNIGKLLGTLINAATGLANIALPALIKILGFLGENINIVIPSAGAFIAVLKGHELAANAAAAAQALFNTALELNPAVLAVGAVAALSGAVFMYAMSAESAEDCTIKLSDEYLSLCDSVEKQKTAYDELKAAQDEQANASLAQLDRIEALCSELDTLTDSTGRVNDADKARANFIAEQVNSVIPGYLSIVDDQIVKNKDLTKSITDIINAERAKIILKSEEEAYNKAVVNVSEAQTAQAQTAARLAAEQSKLGSVTEKYNDSLKKTGTASIYLIQEKIQLEQSVKSLTETLGEQTKTYETYLADINRYESDYAAVLEGNADAVQAVVDRKKNSYNDEKLALAQSEDEKKDILAQSVIDTEMEYQLLAEKFANGEAGITQATVDSAKERADKAKEQFKAVGGNIVDGIIVGVSEKSGFLNASLASLIEKGIAAAKAAADIHSPSRVMRDEVGKMLAEGVALGIEENAKDATTEFKKMLSALDAEKDLGVISDEEYYDRLKTLRDKYLSVGTKEWTEYTAKILKYLDDTEKAAEDSIEKARDNEFKALKKQLESSVITEEQYYNKLASLRDKYFTESSDEWQQYSSEIAKYHSKITEESAAKTESLLNGTKSKLKGFGELYTKITKTYKGAGENGEDFVITGAELTDLTAQTKQLREYADTLAAVKERGKLPDGFFDELKGLSIEDGLEFAKALLKADDTEFKSYLDSYREKAEEIARIAAELNTDEIRDEKDRMLKKLEEMYGEVPADFFDCGTDSAGEFGNGFLERLPEVFKEIQDAFNEGLQRIIPQITFSSAAAGGSSGGNSYTASYNFYSSGQTVAQQLAQARAAETVNRLRNG